MQAPYAYSIESDDNNDILNFLCKFVRIYVLEKVRRIIWKKFMSYFRAFVSDTLICVTVDDDKVEYDDKAKHDLCGVDNK
jgi:hypothetical protein